MEFLGIHLNLWYRVGAKKMTLMDEYYDEFVGDDVGDYYDDYYDDYNEQ